MGQTVFQAASWETRSRPRKSAVIAGHGFGIKPRCGRAMILLPSQRLADGVVSPCAKPSQQVADLRDPPAQVTAKAPRETVFTAVIALTALTALTVLTVSGNCVHCSYCIDCVDCIDCIDCIGMSRTCRPVVTRTPRRTKHAEGSASYLVKGRGPTRSLSLS